MDTRLSYRFSIGTVAGAAGLLVLVAGTFLPWLRSGRVERNSYRSGGELQRILDTHGALNAALTAWPFLALAAAGAVVIFALGLHRTAAMLAIAISMAVGAVSIAAMQQHSVGPVGTVQSGPIVTLVGATVLLVAATLILISAGTARTARS